MGREATCQGRWKDGSGLVKLHLDASQLSVRGDLKRTVALSQMTNVHAKDGWLRAQTAEGEIAFQLGDSEAESWAKKLSSPPPTLAEKLGIKPGMKVAVIGSDASPELAAALQNSLGAPLEEADLVIAVTHDEDALESAADAQQTLGRSVPLWLVHEKGKGAFNGDVVRVLMRQRGFMDNKVASISGSRSATRFAPMK